MCKKTLTEAINEVVSRRRLGITIDNRPKEAEYKSIKIKYSIIIK